MIDIEVGCDVFGMRRRKVWILLTYLYLARCDSSLISTRIRPGLSTEVNLATTRLIKGCVGGGYGFRTNASLVCF